jgi:type IV secretion system protein VirB11
VQGAVNSGHPGSITTVHADTPDGALHQIALLALTAGLDLGWSQQMTYVEQVIDVVVQLDRKDGRRGVAEVRFRPGTRS